MKFTLIVCTYMRAMPLLKLLQSVNLQTIYPDEILIIDGSTDNNTKIILEKNKFSNLQYFKVSDADRGLTKQRNFGISKVAVSSEIVCFLDDDTVLEFDYFEQLIKTFQDDQYINGVGGVAINENGWGLCKNTFKYNKKFYYCFEGFVYQEDKRNILRNFLGLESNLGPGKMPEFSHGRTCGFPLTGETYEVDLLIGMSMAFRKKTVDLIKFSTYFEGYGLYEDADYSIRALKFGKNVINTKVKLSHFHDASGRPNQYHYGKMVVVNGWYVWRVKYPNPRVKAKFKWHMITMLLIMIRFSNVFTQDKKKNALMESMGRVHGWISLIFFKPNRN